MGKADQKKTQNAITKTVDQNQQMAQAGINESTARVNQLTGRSDEERSKINNYYSSAANGGKDYYGGLTGGVRPSSSPEMSGGGDPKTASGGGGSTGGSGGGSASGGNSDYMSIWNELGGSNGGFDPTRLANITNISKQLGNTSGNFKNTDSAMSALMEFAKSGGISDEMKRNINRQSLLDMEKDGGYSDRDRNMIRSRSNSAISSQYGAMKDDMDRRRAVGSNMGPGWDRAAFKLARQGAQAGADTARDTELGIMDSVRSGRMDAAKTLANNNLSLADLSSRNTLSGYQGAGDLDLRKQGQISNDLRGSADIDLNTQGTINNTRLGAASGMSQDANQRASISASSSAAAAARDDANRRWAAEMDQRDREFGASGLSDMYSRSPTELMQNQAQLMEYRKYATQNGNDEINNRINASRIPGIGSSIRSGLGIVGDIAGMASGGLGGLSKFGNNMTYRAPYQGTPNLYKTM